jgi:hypothetical protein
MVTDRIMEKKHVQLRQAAPASDFSIIGFFPIRVQNIPEVIRTFFFTYFLEVAIISIIDFSCEIKGLGQIDKFFHNYFFP